MFKSRKCEKLSNSKRTAYNIAYKKIENDIGYRDIDTLNVAELQHLLMIKAQAIIPSETLYLPLLQTIHSC